MSRNALLTTSSLRARRLARSVSACALIVAAFALLSVADGVDAMAQGAPSMSDRLARSRTSDPDARMLVEAQQLVYNHDNETVSAVGDVTIYYSGDVLQADRVVYDQRNNRVRAEGNVKMTDRDGNVIYADNLDLSDDFADGFLQSLQVQRPDRSRFSATRATRAGDRVTVFDQGTYTACEVCESKPERPPLWQVKATRIIHDQQEQMVYYENARLEFFGLPVAYLPFLQHPDPTVKRKTGFLVPTYIANTELGFGARVPFFWNIAPNKDITITPTVLSRQGVLGDVEWRHRLMTGSYSIRAAGLFQADPGAFPSSPRGGGDMDARGALHTTGKFNLNSRWQWGWDVNLLSDKWVLEDYNLWGSSWNEAISTAYLSGLGTRSYFDARGYYFLGLSSDDRQDQIPTVLPLIDYGKTLEQPVLGGQFGFRTNFTSLRRVESNFEYVTGNNVNCALQPHLCLVRGAAGTYSRVSAEAEWKRQIIDPIGQVWTPFAFVRGDVISRNPSDTLALQQFMSTDQKSYGRGMVGAGLEYRYPLVALTTYGTHLLEPIAQVIIRPDETHIRDAQNEDAQSLFFDDTNLFAWDKFSGWDRIEGGSRANVGIQYTWTMPTGAYVNVLFGQSYHLFGRNSFAVGDIANTGLDSGLDSDRSDYVARFYFQATPNWAFASRFRFDEENFGMRARELQARFNKGAFSGSVTYARYDARPAIGITEVAEGVVSNARIKLHENWYVTGGASYDIDRKRFNSTGLGFGYLDECFDFSVGYSSSYSKNSNKDPVHTLMVRLSLRTLGEADFSTTLDGVGLGPLTESQTN